MPRNWLPSWNAPCCAPVAASPERSVSALARLAPVRLKIGRKFAGSAPPLLKKALSALATLQVHAEGAGKRAGAARRARSATQIRDEVQDRVGRGVAQRCREAGGQIAGGQRVERGAAEPARRREDRVGARDVAPPGERRLHRAGERCAAGHIGARRGRWSVLHQIECAGLEGEIAGDRHRAGRVAGREGASAIDYRRTHGADAAPAWRPSSPSRRNFRSSHSRSASQQRQW